MDHLDFTAMDNADPSLEGGFVPIYDREVSTDIRIAESTHGREQGSLETLRVKVLVLGEGRNLSTVKVELSSENDLYFHYVHIVDSMSYRGLQETQRLMIDFPDYPSVVVKMLNCCIKEPNGFMSVLSMSNHGTGRLDFIQNVEYKFVELMSLEFSQSPHDVTKQQITHRYMTMKAKMFAMHNRLQEIHSVIKVKNPSLLLQLQRSESRSSQQLLQPTKFTSRSSSKVLRG